MVNGLWFMVYGLWISSLVVGVDPTSARSSVHAALPTSDMDVLVSDFGVRVLNLGCGVSGFGCKVSASGFGV